MPSCECMIDQVLVLYWSLVWKVLEMKRAWFPTFLQGNVWLQLLEYLHPNSFGPWTRFGTNNFNIGEIWFCSVFTQLPICQIKFTSGYTAHVNHISINIHKEETSLPPLQLLFTSISHCSRYQYGRPWMKRRRHCSAVRKKMLYRTSWSCLFRGSFSLEHLLSTVEVSAQYPTM